MANENEKVLKARLRQKHDIEANWIKAGNAETPFVPLAGELIIYDKEVLANGSVAELPAGRTVPYTYSRFKIGDGFTNVNQLEFAVSEFTHSCRISGTTSSDPQKQLVAVHIGVIPDSSHQKNSLFDLCLIGIDSYGYWKVYGYAGHYYGEDGAHCVTEILRSPDLVLCPHLSTYTDGNTVYCTYYITMGIYSAGENAQVCLKESDLADDRIVDFWAEYVDELPDFSQEPDGNLYTMYIKTPVEVVQETGESETVVMSQKAVTDELSTINDAIQTTQLALDEKTEIISVDSLPTENVQEGSIYRIQKAHGVYYFYDDSDVEPYEGIANCTVHYVDTLPEIGIKHEIGNSFEATTYHIYKKKGDNEWFYYQSDAGNWYGNPYAIFESIEEAKNNGDGFVPESTECDLYAADKSDPFNVRWVHLNKKAVSNVTTLPMDDIDEEGFYKTSENFASTYVKHEDGSIKVDSLLGVPVTVHVVDELPTQGEPAVVADVADSPTRFTAYYCRADKMAYGYYDSGEGVYLWIPLQELLVSINPNATWEEIQSLDEVTNTDVLYIRLNKNAIFHYDGEWHELVDTIVQTTGESETAVMSQKATTLEFNNINTDVKKILGMVEYIEEPVLFDPSKFQYYPSRDECSNTGEVYGTYFDKSKFNNFNPLYFEISLSSWDMATPDNLTGIFYLKEGQLFLSDFTGDQEAVKFFQTVTDNEVKIFFSSDYFGVYDTTGDYIGVHFSFSERGTFYEYESLPSGATAITEETLYEKVPYETYEKVRWAINADHATTADRATSATSATTAGSATKATQDGSSHTITSYYCQYPTSSPLSIDGDTLKIKYTRGSGSYVYYSTSLANLTSVKNNTASSAENKTAIKNIKGYLGEEEQILFDSSKLSYRQTETDCAIQLYESAIIFNPNSLNENEIVHVKADKYDEFWFALRKTGDQNQPFQLIDFGASFYIEDMNSITIYNISDGTCIIPFSFANESDQYGETYVQSSIPFTLTSYYGGQGVPGTPYTSELEPYYSDPEQIFEAVHASKNIYDEATSTCLTWADIQAYIDQRIQEALSNQ